MNGSIVEVPVSVDEPWNWNIRSEIFCRTKEEKDELQALSLMHGREIPVTIWNDFLKEKQVLIEVGTLKVHTRSRRVLPVCFTTWHTNLRGF